MPNRDFDTATWTDPWVETLNPMQKLLFFYLWTNNHCTSAGLYYISIKRISDESGLKAQQVRDIMPTLAPKVLYDETANLVWVRNFVRKQRRGNRFMLSVCNNLAKMKPHAFIFEFLKEYSNFNELTELQEKYNSSSAELLISGAVLCIKKEEGVVGEEGNNGNGKKLYGTPERILQKKVFVKLSEHEYLELCKRFGRKGAEDKIEELNQGISSKGYKYKDHYDTILSWDRKKNGVRHLGEDLIGVLNQEIEKHEEYITTATESDKPQLCEKERQKADRKRHIIELLRCGLWTIDEYGEYQTYVRAGDITAIKKMFEEVKGKAGLLV